MFDTVLVSIVGKRHCDHGNSCNRRHLIGAGLQFSDLVSFHHGRGHGSVLETDTVLER